METIIQEQYDYLIDFAFANEQLWFDDIRLYQVGKKFCNQNTTVHSHIHIDWFEITIILEGKGSIYTNGERVSVSEGDIFLSFPCDTHKITSDSNEPLKYSFLSFCLRNDYYKKEFETITQKYYECPKRIFKNPTIVSLVEYLIAEMAVNLFEKDKFISLTLQQVLILLARNFLHSSAKLVPNHTSNNKILCYNIMRHIDNNIFSIGEISEIATYFNYNYSYLSKIFKQTTQLTLTEYFSNKKLAIAKVLIRENQLSFTKIAELLHYASIYSFSKSFKFHFGVSPAEYRKNSLTPKA